MVLDLRNYRIGLEHIPFFQLMCCQCIMYNIDMICFCYFLLGIFFLEIFYNKKDRN